MNERMSECCKRFRFEDATRDLKDGISEGKGVLNHVFDGLCDAVRVDLLEETVARVKEFIDRVNLLGGETDVIVDDLAVFHQPLKVVTRFDPDVETIARNVIKLVDVDAVVSIGHNIKAPHLLLSLFFPLVSSFIRSFVCSAIQRFSSPNALHVIESGLCLVASDQIGDEIDVFAAVIEVVVVDQVSDHLFRHLFVVPLGDAVGWSNQTHQQRGFGEGEGEGKGEGFGRETLCMPIPQRRGKRDRGPDRDRDPQRSPSGCPCQRRRALVALT